MNPKQAALFTIAAILGLSWSAPLRAETPDLTESSRPDALATRTTLLVALPAQSAWQDMAFLAAVPAATLVNHGAPSLIALDEAGTLTPEIKDYLRRYRPTAVWQIGGPPVAGPEPAALRCVVMPATSADAAACCLSAKFWDTCAIAVVCPEADYAAGLVAAPLAARLRAPLLFVAGQGLSPQTAKELQRLHVKELIIVGKPAAGSGSLKQVTDHVTELAGATEVMAWVRQRDLTVSYLAALNPLDRGQAVIRKLSLAGALLAAGREGLVAPLSYPVQWKLPFNGTEITGEVPPGLPPSEAKPKTGQILLENQAHAFVLTGGARDRGQRLHVDLDGDGKFTGPGEGPLVTGDTVTIAGRCYVITLGAKNGAGKADVRLSWPRAEQLVEDLRGYYGALGAPPEHLCLTGFPDVLPQAIIGHGGVVEEQTSDLPYANADDDPFAEIGVARVVAESASLATLFASRVLTYNSLLDADWQDRACQARWESTYGNLFENVGFDASFRHTEQNLKWIEPPAEGKKGKRAQTFEQDSPAARCAVLTHMDHSWWHELGHTFAWDAGVLLAPVVVESGGCLTAALDREADDHSVIARLFRQGAVAFAGNSREGCAPQELQRMEFWNGVLSGLTIGQAHRKSINSALVTVLDKKEGRGGGYAYQLRIRTQFGDPAFAMRVPAAPRSAPARITVAGDTVTVHSPAQWWPVRMVVPEDWKQWTGKDLFVLRGAGTYALREWCAQQYDREETCMTAEFTTRRHVAKIEQQGPPPPAPLGWSGSWHVDEHADGSRTYRWAVRLADFDQTKGNIINAVGHLDYRVVYQ